MLMHKGGFKLTAGGTCAAVVGMKDCLSNNGYISPLESNDGGWRDCRRRTWCNGAFRDALPAAFKSLFKQFKVQAATGAGNSSAVTNDYFALPAEKEMFGENNNSSSVAESTLFLFDWYMTEANRIKKRKGSANAYWLRSAYDQNNYAFCYAYDDGTVGWGEAYSDFVGISPFGVI